MRGRTHADRPALVAGRRTVTYAELDARATRVARQLAARGVVSGDRVGTTLPPGVAFAELLHAVPRIGAVLVPLNTRDPDPPGECRLVIDEPVRGAEADVELLTSTDAREPWVVLHTSGTTGAAKAVELTFGNFAHSAVASVSNLGRDPDDRWLCILPLFHVGGLSILTRSVIYGTCAILHERFEPEAARESLESGQATLVSLVPTQLRRLRDAGLSTAPRLRAALLGGGPIPSELLAWAEGVGLPVIPTYGMTETCSQIATPRLLPNVEVHTSESGELLVRGPMVAPGSLAEDGWLHTGDLGHVDADGTLNVEGRIKDVIVTGGENVAAPEVEDALQSHPAVADAAVVGKPDEEWGEAVTAYVVLVAEAADEELAAHCRERLAGYKVPRAFVRVAELPRTASGKLQKDRLTRVTAP